MIVKLMILFGVIIVALLMHYVILPKLVKRKIEIDKIKRQKKKKRNVIPPPIVYPDIESIHEWLEKEEKRRRESDGDFNPSER